AAVIVSLALTIVGLFMVSFLIGLGTDVVRELMELSQLRPPELRGHTIVVNIDLSTQQLLHELLRYSQKLFPEGALSRRWVQQLLSNTKRGIAGARYLVVGRSPDPPDFLRQGELARIVYRQGQLDDETFLIRTDVAEAQRVVLFADLHAEDPDAETIQALLTITESLREADAKRRDLPLGGRRARLLIAEILDESNVPAAREAIIGAGVGGLPDKAKPTRAFVVPSERLIALYMACVTRRPGIGRLLEELLTSHGHELYTLFFSMEGLGYYQPNRPSLPDSPEEIMSELIRRARSLSSRQRVVPVAVLLASDNPEEVEVHINPETGSLGFEQEADVEAPQLAVEGTVIRESELELDAGTGVDETHEEVGPDESGLGDSARRLEASGVETMGAGQIPCLGFVAIAANFSRIRELADDLYDRPSAAVPSDQAGSPNLPQFCCAATTPLRRVLICG
ncbi:MAG: hypothetical protein KC431_03620, partial [Myxococcales bacterium]|nr:hypothetical protein [Myxococcales bacterium]